MNHIESSGFIGLLFYDFVAETFSFRLGCEWNVTSKLRYPGATNFYLDLLAYYNQFSFDRNWESDPLASCVSSTLRCREQ